MLSRAYVSFLVAVLCVSALQAQQVGTGVYAFGSYDAKGFDTINLGNLNVHAEVPIVNKPGRGLPFVYSIVYDSLIWSTVSNSGTTYWQPDISFGFRGQLYGAIVGYLTYNTIYIPCTQELHYQQTTSEMVDVQYHDPYGRAHTFNYKSGYSCPGGPAVSASGDGSTSDGSGYSYSGGYVYSKTGAKIEPNYSSSGTGGTITDANGNTITNNTNGTFTDVLGVTELTISGGGNASSPLQLQYPIPQQTDGTTTATATVYYKTYTVQTNFGCSGISEYGATSADLVDHITLADQSTTYSFTYEPTPGNSSSVTGRLASITLPAGGAISYVYTGGCGGGINTDGTVSTLARTATTNQTNYTKTYTHSIAQAPTNATTEVDEEGNETDLSFIPGSTGLLYEISRTAWQGAATANTQLESKTTSYNGQSPTTSALTAAVTQTAVVDQFNGLRPLTTASTFDRAGNLKGTVLEDASNNNAPISYSVYNYNSISELTSSATYDSANSNALITGMTYGYDEATPTATSNVPQHSAVSGTRGNLTSTHSWVGGNTYVSSTNAYYDTGALLSSTVPYMDAGTGTASSSTPVTQYTFDSTQTFATQTTLPTPSSGVTISTSASFDTNSGIQSSSTGPNTGQTLTYGQYDRLLRPMQLTTPSPDNGQLSLTYTPNQVSETVKLNSSQTADQETFLDGYGRTARVAVWNGANWYLTDTCYDPDGRVQYQSVQYLGSAENPSGNNCTSSLADQYTYDALGRTTAVSHPDGSSVSFTYRGRATLMSSSTGVSRITQYDLLGRISSVCELSTNSNMPGSGSPSSCGADITGSGFLTNYAYNLSAHTTTITQGAQVRTFQTDALGRPTSITEPELGNTTYTYTYNSTGLQVVRTRPQANIASAPAPNPIPTTTTTVQYDLLGRLLSETYSDGTPTKTFVYDTSMAPSDVPVGQLSYALTSTSSGTVHAKNYVYDIMGRVFYTVECLPDWCGSPNSPSHDVHHSYSYNSASQLSGEGYATTGEGGSFVSLTYGYNNAGQLTSVSGGQNNATLSPSIYSATSMLPGGPNVTQLGNGLSAPYLYDSRDLLAGGWVCNGSTQINCSGGSALYGFYKTTSGNEVTSMVDTVVGQGVNFNYDEFGRLAGQTHSYGGNTTAMSFVYDRYGNRTQQNVTQGSGPQPQFSFNTANNQVSGYQYDVAGNVINDGTHSYEYDAENNLISIDSGSTATYTYDALNERVKVATSSATEHYSFNLAGQRSTSWDGSGDMDSAQYYAGSTPVAYWLAADGNIHFEHQDWLGTERLRTSATGTVEGSYSSLPFGDGASVSGADTNAAHFAQLDHDLSASSGLEHAAFREYSSSSGSWMSPDSYQGSYRARNPQSFNRYAYVLNRPTSAVDPLGQDLCSECDDPGDGGGGTGGLDGGGGYVGVGGDGGCGPTDGSCVSVSSCAADACVTAPPETVTISTGSVCDVLDCSLNPVPPAPDPYPCSDARKGGAHADFCPPAAPQAPSNQSQQIAKQISTVNQCTQQMQGVLNGQPSVTPTTQNLLDGLYGAVYTVLTDGFGKILSGFFKGASVRSVGHAVQKGGTALMTYNTCLVSAGQATPYNPYTPF